MLEEKISTAIFVIRGQKVLLDNDIANLYGVETKVLNQAVKRNIDRFPSDFMFQLTLDEWKNLKSQFVTSKNINSSWGGRRTAPYSFTEQGVAMLSSVLKSEQAIKINISIMRVFVKIREFAVNYKKLLNKIEELQKTDKEQDKHIANIYRIIEELVKPEIKKKYNIGF